MAEEEVRARLRGLAGEIRAIRERVAALRAGVPPSPQETSEEDLQGEPDLATEIGAVLGTVLSDCLDPMIADLAAAAEYRPAAHGEAPAPGTAVRLDLATVEEAMRPVVRALVVKDNFTARASDEEAGEIWLPGYTPEQAGLRVWKAYGRWFAAWRKLEVPDDLPEDERWEFLLVEEDERLPGHLVYREIQPG
jgi:hypothetical protein